MVLTIDIGNTTIGIGGFQGNKLLFIEKLSSRRPLSDAGYRKKLNMILDKHGLSAEAFEGSVISSVVPSVTAVFSSALEAFMGQKPLLLIGAGQLFLCLYRLHSFFLGACLCVTEDIRQ